MAVARLPEMSWWAASAAHTRRKAQATTAEPKTTIAGAAGRCAPERRKSKAGSATTIATTTLLTGALNQRRAALSILGRRTGRGKARLAVLLQHAAIHHHRQAGVLRPLRRGVVDAALLQPDRGHAELDGLVHVRPEVGAPAEMVHHVHRERDFGQPWVDLLAEDFATSRPHRHDAVPVGL